jgi:hypothetical protein
VWSRLATTTDEDSSGFVAGHTGRREKSVTVRIRCRLIERPVLYPRSALRLGRRRPTFR